VYFVRHTRDKKVVGVFVRFRAPVRRRNRSARVKARSVPPRLRAQAVIVSRMPQAAAGTIAVAVWSPTDRSKKLYDRLVAWSNLQAERYIHDALIIKR
jgi:hypothetical protein